MFYFFRTLCEFIAEAALIVIYPLAGILGCVLRPKNKVPPVETLPVVVFIAGWLTAWPLYWGIKRDLEAKGHRILFPSLRLQLGDLTKSAVWLDKYVSNQNLGNIILVGASAGAVIGYLYLQRANGWDKVRYFISVGAPYKGSKWAYGGFFSKACRQLIPQSSLLTSLSQEPVRHPNRIVCVSARFDELVSRSSSTLPGVRHITVDVIGHVHLQVTRRTSNIISECAAPHT